MRHQRISQEALSSCRCSHVDQETMKKNASQMFDSFFFLQRDLEQDNSHFLVPGSEETWYSISEDCPQGEWDRIAEKMMLENWRKQTSSLPCHESIVQRSVQKQRRWKTVDTLLCRFGNDKKLFFAQLFL